MLVRGDILSIRNVNSDMSYLDEEKRLNVLKVKYVVFEYTNTADLNINLINKLSTGKLAGVISYSKKRAEKRNKRSSYAMRIEPGIYNSYARLLGRIGIHVKKVKAKVFYRSES